MKELKVTDLVIIGLFLVGIILFVTQETRSEELSQSNTGRDVSAYSVDWRWR